MQPVPSHIDVLVKLLHVRSTEHLAVQLLNQVCPLLSGHAEQGIGALNAQFAREGRAPHRFAILSVRQWEPRHAAGARQRGRIWELTESRQILIMHLDDAEG